MYAYILYIFCIYIYVIYNYIYTYTYYQVYSFSIPLGKQVEEHKSKLSYLWKGKENET